MKLVSTNPSDNYSVIGEVESSTDSEVIDAVKKAHEAKERWRNLTIKDRIPYFEKFISLLDANREVLASLQTKEIGKLITESRSEVDDSATMVKWIIDNAEKHLTPEVLDETETQITELHKEPYGVVASIVPWNFPVSNFIIGVMQVLICGNVVVFKHSEECPLTGKMLASLMDKAGFPQGVFSEIYGDGKTGQSLIDQDIDFITFTGSSKVGKQLYEKAAQKFIKARLELGGSSPGVIFEDADLEKAIPFYCEERFLACGQVCCALKRLIVHESIVDQVVAKMKAKIEAMVIGNPIDENTTLGPLVAKRQQVLLKEQFDDAVAKGVTVVTGGNIPSALKGAYFEPTLLTNVTPDMRVVTEEVFGPILPVITFKTEAEAIALANNTNYGLSAFVYSGDTDRAMRVASKISAGQLSVNGASYFTDNATFGGYKESGIGRGDGKYGFYESTQTKVVARPKK